MTKPVIEPLPLGWIPFDKFRKDVAWQDVSLVKRDAVVSWVQDFLCLPDQALGRSGFVCPSLPRSIEREQLYMSIVSLEFLDSEQIYRMLQGQISSFIEVTNRLGESASEMLGLIIVCPKLPESLWPSLSAIHKRIMRSYAEGGLISYHEFYPGHPKGAVHNSDFRVYDAPVVSFGLRLLGPGDGLLWKNGERPIPPSLPKEVIAPFQSVDDSISVLGEIVFSGDGVLLSSSDDRIGKIEMYPASIGCPNKLHHVTGECSLGYRGEEAAPITTKVLDALAVSLEKWESASPEAPAEFFESLRGFAGHQIR
jgi:hypothetical protein